MPEQSGHHKPATVIKDGAALRCCCGSLLARLVTGGVELKCRRCKRQMIIPFVHGSEVWDQMDFEND